MIRRFDSGHSGVTVLRTLVDWFQDRSLLYYGTMLIPLYGERTSE
jgi:glutamate racemase